MKSFLVFMTSLLFLSVAQADYILKYKMDTDSQTYMYHSGISSKLSMASGHEKTEIYTIGKKVYLVSYDGANKTIMDMDEMKKMSQAFGAMDSSAENAKQRAPKYKIIKTGKKEKIAGISGEVWIVSGKEDGEKFTQEMVVTNDKKVVKVAHSMFNTFANMSNSNEGQEMLEPQKGYVILKVDTMVLKSFEELKLPSSTYQLPKDGQEQKMPDFSKLKKKVVDSCYDQVCCGQISGPSTVLAPALKNSFNSYKLVGSGVCDAMGLGSLLNLKSVEGALYKKGSDSIQITLNLNDTKGGILRSTKKNLDAGYSTGLVSSIKNYSDGKKLDAMEIVSGVLMPMNQETLEYIIDEKTSLTITRLRKTGKEPSLSGVISSGAINLKKIKTSVASNKTSSSNSQAKEDMDADEAIDMLKSFF